MDEEKARSQTLKREAELQVEVKSQLDTCSHQEAEHIFHIIVSIPIPNSQALTFPASVTL